MRRELLGGGGRSNGGSHQRRGRRTVWGPLAGEEEEEGHNDGSPERSKKGGGSSGWGGGSEVGSAVDHRWVTLAPGTRTATARQRGWRHLGLGGGEGEYIWCVGRDKIFWIYI